MVEANLKFANKNHSKISSFLCLQAQQIKLEMDKLDEEQNKLQDELTEAAAMAATPRNNVEMKDPDAEQEDEDKEKEPTFKVEIIHNRVIHGF